MGSLLRRTVLTAYLDGELSQAQQRRLEAALERSATLRSQLEALQRVVHAVSNLPEAALPASVAESVSAALHAKLPGGLDSDISPEEMDLLLAAYAQGELDEASSVQVERMLLNSAEYRGAVRSHRRIARAIRAFDQRPMPPEVLSLLLDRLHRLIEIRPALARGAKRPFGELLTAYLDSEIAGANRRRVQACLVENPCARKVLDGFSRVRDGLSHIPRKSAPAALMNAVLRDLASHEISAGRIEMEANPEIAIDADWVAAAASARNRSHGWLTLGLSAACVVLAMLGVWTIQILAPEPSPVATSLAKKTPAKINAPQAPPPIIDETPLPDLADALPPVATAPMDDMGDLDELAAIDPTSLASEIHEMQLTLSADDVHRAVREFKSTLDIDFNPDTTVEAAQSSQPVFVVELHGEPSEVSLVLNQLREMSRRGELMNQVGIRKPTAAMLATMHRENAVKPESSVTASPTSKGAIRVLLVLQSKTKP